MASLGGSVFAVAFDLRYLDPPIFGSSSCSICMGGNGDCCSICISWRNIQICMLSCKLSTYDTIWIIATSIQSNYIPITRCAVTSCLIWLGKVCDQKVKSDLAYI